MSQTLSYAVELSGALKAARDADEFNKKLSGTDNAAAAVDKSLAKLELKMKQLNDAIKEGKGNTQAYANELSHLKSEYERVSGSVFKMGEAVKQATPKTANLGQAALETSRGLEDLQYGIGGVVNNIPSLVMALGGGAGLTAAISLGAVAVNQMVKEWTKVDPAVKEATDAAKERVTKLKDEVILMRRELAVLRSSEGKVAVAEAEQTLAEVEKRARDATQKLGVILGNYDGIKAFELVKSGGAGSAEVKQIFKDAEAVMKEYYIAKEGVDLKNKKSRISQIELDGKAADAHSQMINDQIAFENELAKYREEQAEKARKAEEKVAEENRRVRDKIANDEESTRAKREADEMARRDKWNEKRLEDQIKADKKRIEQTERAESEIAKIKKRRMDQVSNYADNDISNQLAMQEIFTDAIKARLGTMEDVEFNSLSRKMDAQQRHYDSIGKITEEYSAKAIDIGQQYIDMMVKGEEDKEKKIGVIILRQAGQALIGSGIKSLGYAAENIAFGPAMWPQAAAAGAIGAGLIGAGMTLGGVASGIEGQIQTTASAKKDAEKAQNKLDKEREREAKRERGLSPSRSSSGGSGNIVLNLTYGVSGPLPEDTARLIKRELATASRRNGA